MQKTTTRTKSSKNNEYQVPNSTQSNPKQPDFKKKRLSLSIKLIKKHTPDYPGYSDEDEMIPTFAIKNSSTYLIIGTDRKITIIQDQQNIYSAKFLKYDGSTLSALYIDCLDCFLFLAKEGKELYIKDIDDKKPYLFMSFPHPSVGWFYSNQRQLRYSSCHRKLVYVQNSRFSQFLSVVNLDTKRIEFKFKNGLGYMNSFCLFGKYQNKIAATSCWNILYIFVVSYSMKKLLAYNEFIINFDPEDESLDGSVSSLSACDIDDEEYILLQSNIKAKTCARVLVFKVSGSELTKVAALYDDHSDSLDISLIDSRALGFCGCFERHLLWVGFEFHLGIARVFAFDRRTNELQELKSKRTKHFVKYPTEIQRRGDNFYCVGGEGQLVKLSLNYLR